MRQNDATARRDEDENMLAALFVLAVAASAAPAAAAVPQHCIHPVVVLWGDGRHDDTKALQAWLDGKNALWGDSGAPVGATSDGHTFRLSAAIFVAAGSGRMLENFRLYWPERGETVSGGAISAGRDPNRPPAMTGVRIVGGDNGEGKPIALPDAPPQRKRAADASCGIS